MGFGALSILLLLAAALGVLYVRLVNGGLSLAFLTSRIEQALAEDLDGSRVTIQGADLKLDNGKLVLGLTQVALQAPSGPTIAQIPEAHGVISTSGLKRGRLALSRVDLVAPRLNLAVGADGSLALSLGAGATAGPTARSSSSPAATVGETVAGTSADVVRALSDASARARRRETASGFLREVGVKNAVVVVTQAGHRSVWNVAEAHADLAHRREHSTMSGRASIATLTGPLVLTATTTETQNADRLTLDIGIEGFNPRGLARLIPGLAPLETVDLPMTGKAQVVVATDGSIVSAVAEAGANGGLARFGLLGKKPVPMEATRLKVAYDSARRVIEVGEVTFGWGGSRVSLTGQMAREPNGAGWTYALQSTDGVLASPKAKLRGARIDQARASGRFSTTENKFALQDLSIKAAGTEVVVKGDVVWTNGVPGGELTGRLSPMSADVLVSLWPSLLAPGVRDWVATHVPKGQLAGGLFKTVIDGTGGEAAARLSLTLEASGVEVQTVKGMPPFEIARGLLRVEGQTIEITSPEVVMTASENRKVQFRTARFTAVDTGEGDQPTAEVAFRMASPLAALADLADRAPLQLLKSNGIAAPGLDGRVEGALKITFPLAENVQMTEVRGEGKLRISDIRARQVAGPHDISGGTLTIDIGDKVVDLKGDLLVKGTPAKIGWQYQLHAPLAQQPPLKATTLLDSADRNTLGMDVADLVQGETPVEVLVAFGEGGAVQPRVRVDLTKAELMFEPIAWRKAPGRPATLMFEPVKGPGTGAAQRLELQNFKLTGDDIALEGWLAIGPDQKPREFSFPELTLNVISRFAAHGKRRPDGVWEITAKGPTFDGRDVFRGLFNVGQQPNAAKKEKPGFDLSAEIDTVLGFSETSLKGLKLRLGQRLDKMTELDLKSTFINGKPFNALVRQQPGVGRQLLAEAKDAGLIFKLVGFYPSAVGGEMQLEVDLDAKGANEKSGTLWASKFSVLGDSIVGDLYQSADSQPPSGQGPGQPKRGTQKKVVRQQFDFDGLRIPFAVGSGQMVMNGAVIRGPIIGASFRGEIDFKQQLVNLGGTYVPLSGLNQALGSILGPLTGGPQGDGLFGITFQVVGPLANPQVIANPLSLLGPGFLREIFQMTPETFNIRPRSDQAPSATAPAVRARGKGDPARSSSAPAAQTEPSGGGAAPRPPGEVLPDWTSSVKPAPRSQLQPEPGR